MKALWMRSLLGLAKFFLQERSDRDDYAFETDQTTNQSMYNILNISMVVEFELRTNGGYIN